MPKFRSRFGPQAIIIAIPFAFALFVWLSPLAFIPVPWPDDSAFYLVARDLFKWPSRWVMLSQAPFEPSYREFNFNTMPLYPILIGLGRGIGIDGSFGLKFWPLTAWAMSVALLGVTLFRKKLLLLPTLLIVTVATFDPTLRWASVLVRPESLIGLFGMCITLGLTFGFPHRFRKRRAWHPISALLALAAYTHFNAIHLVFPVAITLLKKPRQILQIAAKTTLYLVPWIFLVLFKLPLFLKQMTVQWSRLSVSNSWLESPAQALRGLIQEMGSPIPLTEQILWASGGLWILIFLALGVFIWALITQVRQSISDVKTPNILPASAWVISSFWLWHSKPEVWFVYYLHLSIWTFAGVFLSLHWENRFWRVGLLAVVTGTLAVFVSTTYSQTQHMSEGDSWRWPTYHQFIDCIDEQLIQYEKRLGNPKPFRVWAPTFPDILIELSRKHPDWELSRTNDFAERAALGVRHGREVEAVVIPETIQPFERYASGTSDQFPGLNSIWLKWRGYFLSELGDDPTWKRDRYICLRGRWHGFIYMNPVK